MKYFASVAPLIFLAKTLIWNKITFPASNSLDVVKLGVNESMKSFCKKIYQYFSFLFNLSLVNVNISRAYNERTKLVYKNSRQYSLLLIMN